MSDKQGKNRSVTRRGFLKGTATMAAAGGLITSAPVISKAAPRQRKNPIYFKELPVSPYKMADDVSQIYLATSWPDNPYTNTQIELMTNDKEGRGMGTGFTMFAPKEPGFSTPKQGEYSSSIRQTTIPQSATWPYRSSMNCIYTWASQDPKRPDYVGLEMEVWQGDIDESEQYILTKPGAWVYPKDRLHGPHYFRKVDTQMLWTVCLSGPSNNHAQEVGKWPKGFTLDRLTRQEWPKDKPRKYAGDFPVFDPSEVTLPPSHKGKVVPVMFMDYTRHHGIDRTIDERMILEAGVGFGIGESSGDGLWDFTEWPQKHHFTETYIFCPKDPNEPDLGAEVEFWVGEGDDAEKYNITQKTVITIPPNIYHFPMVVRKLVKPFYMITVSEIPVWTSYNKHSLPPGFKV